MTSKLRVRVLTAILLGAAVIAVGACARRPTGIDGGIVGTGNRVDCEAEARKGTVPELCKPGGVDERRK